MRKGTKGMLIAAGIFAAAGIGLCVGGLSMGAASEGSQIMAKMVNSFRDNTYTGAAFWKNIQKYRQCHAHRRGYIHRIGF